MKGLLNDKIHLLLQLKKYILSDSEEWEQIQDSAERKNGWFTREFILKSIQAIAENYLDENALQLFSERFSDSNQPRTVGVVMAGNIPLVGFHDFLCVFLSPHRLAFKCSSKDDVLLPAMLEILKSLNPDLMKQVEQKEMLKNCDAYLATGSNHTAKVFKNYFGKYPHIIRPNKTSVAVLKGHETEEELSLLADDVYQYFGLGCRNVTKIFVPHDYPFEPLLQAFRKYDHLKDHNKYRNNLDYQLALYILNNQYYMSNDSVLLIEHDSIFSAVSVLHYSYYSDHFALISELQNNPNIQTIVGHGFTPFGAAQHPGISDFADGIDTIDFLNSLS